MINIENYRNSVTFEYDVEDMKRTHFDLHGIQRRFLDWKWFNAKQCADMLMYRSHVINGYDRFIEEIVRRVIARAAKDNYDMFNTGWCINTHYHGIYQDPGMIKYRADDSCLIPIYVDIDYVFGGLVASTPKIEYVDKLIITFDISSKEKFAQKELCEALKQEFRHIHTDYAFIDEDLKILSKWRRVEPEINSPEDYKDLIPHKIMTRAEYDGVDIYAFKDLLFISRTEEENKRIERFKEYVNNINIEDLKTYYREYAVYNAFRQGVSVDSIYYSHDVTDVLLYNPAIDNEYCLIELYGSQIYRIWKILAYNSGCVGSERLKELMCLGFVLNKQGILKTEPFGIDEEELERLYFKNYTEKLNKEEIDSLWSIYRYFESRFEDYVYRIYDMIWTVFMDRGLMNRNCIPDWNFNLSNE